MRVQMLSYEVTILKPSGYITAANVTEFQKQLRQAVTDPDNTTFLIDMTLVEFLDSAGLMALASALCLAQSLGKRLSLCSLAPSVQMIFELTQLDNVFEIFPNRDDFEGVLSPPIAA
jgi:anti-anti-sigma factor